MHLTLPAVFLLFFQSLPVGIGDKDVKPSREGFGIGKGFRETLFLLYGKRQFLHGIHSILCRPERMFLPHQCPDHFAGTDGQGSFVGGIGSFTEGLDHMNEIDVLFAFIEAVIDDEVNVTAVHGAFLCLVFKRM